MGCLRRGQVPDQQGPKPLQCRDHILPVAMSESRLPLRITVIASLWPSVWRVDLRDSASNRVVSMVTPYKIDIVQGNVVTREQVTAVKPGMPKAQVRDIMGTALLTSIFHADRWDYVFTLKEPGVAPQSRHVTVYFTRMVLSIGPGRSPPSEAEFVASLSSHR